MILNFQNESQMEIELISYLSQCDFPKNCLYKLEERALNCDVVACDKNSLEEVALFECKTKIDENILIRSVNKYQVAYSKLKSKVNFYIVLPGDDVWPFHIYDISDFVNKISDANMNNFELRHITMPTREYIIPGKVKLSKKKSRFQIVYKVYVVFLLILFVMNYLGWYQFTKERLVFLVLLILTSLIPYIDVIKYKDLSLFLNNKNKNK